MDGGKGTRLHVIGVVAVFPDLAHERIECFVNINSLLARCLNKCASKVTCEVTALLYYHMSGISEIANRKLTMFANLTLMVKMTLVGNHNCRKK